MSNVEKMERFIKLCKTQDWTYMYSDDPRAYSEGSKSMDELLRLINGPDREMYLPIWREFRS